MTAWVALGKYVGIALLILPSIAFFRPHSAAGDRLLGGAFAGGLP
jgi:hypothetical protein